MPLQISKLRSLQVLPTFIVGKDNASNVKELRNMSHFGGKLRISKLENVISVQDARAASLNKKQKLVNLWLCWSNPKDVGNQVGILESLQPHLGLNGLGILGYGGPKFPHWLEDVRFNKMLEIKLVNCKNCTLLPCLGQLPLLKRIVIEQMNEVKSVGKEFYGGFVSFPKLEPLTFDDMPQWEVWESSSSSLSESYSCLLRLSIIDCPKLIKELPTYLPSLVNLKIENCPLLECSLARFPSLSQLRIQECNEGVVRGGVDFHSLEDITIDMIAGLTRLQEGFVQLLSGLQVLRIKRCYELRCLWKENEFDGVQQLPTCSCLGLESLGDKEHHGLLSKLQSLEILGCRNLEKLPNGLHRLTCLKELFIEGCSKLSSFPNSGFPPMLTTLVIGSCEGLTRLPDWMMVARYSSDCSHICILEDLDVSDCPSLVCFPEGQLPTTLKHLRISNCEKLSSLPGGILKHHDSTTTPNSDGGLYLLEIHSCPSLKFFPAGKFPSALKELRITGCEQLESLSEKMFHSNHNSLEVVEIGGLNINKCNNLEGLIYQWPNLRVLAIMKCKNVKLVPYKLQALTAFTSLHICNCESMTMPLSQWGLAMLPSLKHLTIRDIFSEITSFSEGRTLSVPLLPTTLTSLVIGDFQNLKSLSSLSLQTLTSLQRLSIFHCPKLESFCPKEGLPDMLGDLCIFGCPLLKERCSRQKGQDWAHVSHIPCVTIEGDNIFLL